MGAILVIGGGIYVYTKNKQTSQVSINTEELKTFTHSNGVFSFQYPSNLRIIEGLNPLAVIYKSPNSNEIALISFFQYFKNGTYGDKKLIFKTTTEKGYKVYMFGSSYMVSLEDIADPSYFLEIGATKNISVREIKIILNSISVDKEKAVKLINESEKIKIDGMSDTSVKVTLPKMQSDVAAPYFVKHNSYIGLCGSTEFSAFIRPITTPIWSKIPSSEISCFSSPNTWAVSAPLFAPLKIPPGIKGYCVDSSGFAGDVSSSAIGLTGKCE